MKFTAVVCSHANPDGLRRIIGCLRYQTRPPDEILAYCSDTPDMMRLRENFPNVIFHVQPNMNDWGHEKRATGIQAARGKWVGFFNDDDDYTADYLERMLNLGDRGNDVVYCGWNEQPDCEFAFGQSTAGNFIVRTGLARQVGWLSREYPADGIFIEGLVAAGAKIGRVDGILYTHNAVRERV